MKASAFLKLKEANPLGFSLLSAAPALPELQHGATPQLSGKEKTPHQNRQGAAEEACDTSVVQWFGVETIGGAEPEVCTLHFDFEKVFRKMIVYCIQFAA